ncbi:MAG TPA: hypothetical protein VFY66_03040, partial [Anaerolineales bacterium]|nr:hypothetical protein [Anaerolineales bacterium]
RGSLFETKYWLNRAQLRQLMQPDEVKDYAARLSEVARQLNSFASSLRAQRKDDKVQPKSIREPTAEYAAGEQLDDAIPLFAEDEFTWLES